MYEDLQAGEGQSGQGENSLPSDVLDRILCGSSESMSALPDNSVHLMVTSPPYNAGKDYDEDLTLPEYLDLLDRVWAEVLRVLVPGGRACVNIANVGRKPYIPFHAHIAIRMATLGFLMRGEVIWHKGSSAGVSTAWGSWLSSSNPTLRDTHEYVLVFSKGSYKRSEPGEKASTMTKEQFLEYTKSIWTFPAESARKIGHPAPFPVELPYRLIELYSFSDDVILDPFMGSGQTAIAALKAGRHYVGYDIDPAYVSLAEKRILQYQSTELAPRLFELPADAGSSRDTTS
jgi:site-specific DNA-methyltransferase (adenine-specific)